MKSFDQFKTIAYKNAIPHTVFSGKKQKRILKGKAISLRSRSSAGGNGDSGDGSGGDGGE